MENTPTQDAVQKVATQSQEFLKDAKIDNLIKDNQLSFSYNEIQYRVCKPSFEQKQLVTVARMKKLIELMKDPNQLMEKDLIELYATRGVSVKEIDDRFASLQSQIESLQLKLGEALAEKKAESELEIYKKEIQFLSTEQSKAMVNKSMLLDTSIESQVNLYSYVYLASILVEKQESTNWVLAWSGYDDLIKQEEHLVNLATWYTSLIAKNSVPFME